ncbi:MAG: GDP-mannose 4,6-dehydratase [Bacteroidia bacterium]|nr:GDP-mannose 4,6-dehydratase [Bacteroidia bacterium]
MNKKALVIGHSGQDGAYLVDLLEQSNHLVFGVSSKLVYTNSDLVIELGDLSNPAYCTHLLKTIQPDYLFYLAAVHQSSVDASVDDLPFYQQTLTVNANNYMNLLNGIQMLELSTKVFYAASSHVFAGTTSKVQNESTPFEPVSIYGISKVLGIHLSDLYRNKGVHIAVGILYNHESPKRASKFVSKKIVETAVAIKLGTKSELVLGDLNATIDWGYAPDYMYAALSLLQTGKSENYIISSGQLHTVGDFVKSVFQKLNLDWSSFVKTDKNILLKKSTNILLGDNQKIQNDINWKPSVSFDEMIEILVNSELEVQK